jgi:hypothetical protein
MLSRGVGAYPFDPFRNRYNVSQQPVMSVKLTAEAATVYAGRGDVTERGPLELLTA